ncbi:MAG: hypothetical protein ACR2NI_04925, partial [Pirellulales bacterium]
MFLGGCPCCGKKECFTPVLTEEDFCGRGYTASYAKELNVKLYDTDGWEGDNTNEWKVTDVDRTYGACEPEEYLKLFLYPNESDLVYNEYDLPYDFRFGNPYYELEVKGEFSRDPDIIKVNGNVLCSNDQVGVGVAGTDLRMFFAPNQPACMRDPIFNTNALCRGLSTGCSSGGVYQYRRFFTRLTDEQQETFGKEIVTGKTVQIPAIGELWINVDCRGSGCLPIEWKIAELEGFVTVKMKCDNTTSKSRTMPTNTTTTGPGTHLKNMLAAWGIHAKKGGGCKCRDWEVKMNRWGSECRKHMD